MDKEQNNAEQGASFLALRQEERAVEDAIWPELHYENLPLWQPDSAGEKEQVFERTLTLPENLAVNWLHLGGLTVTAKVAVKYTYKGRLTTEDQRVYYALLALCEEYDIPLETHIYYCERDLARELGLRFSKKTHAAFGDALYRLSNTRFSLQYAYLSPLTGALRQVNGQPFSILRELSTYINTEGKRILAVGGEFYFYDLPLKELLAGGTRLPLPVNVVPFPRKSITCGWLTIHLEDYIRQ